MVWVLFGVFSNFCILSVGDCTHLQQQETAKNHQGRVGTEEITFRSSLLLIKANHKESCSSVPIVILLTLELTLYKLLILFSILTYLGIGKVIVYFHSSCSCLYSWASKCSLDFPQW